MRQKGQAGMEYVLLIGGAILFAVVAVSLVRSTAAAEGNRLQNRSAEFNAFIRTIQANALLNDNCDVPSSGNWIVNSTVNCVGRAILMNANISVVSGGQLGLYGTVLWFNPSRHGQYGIFVNGTGALGIYDLDNNPATTADASNLTNGPANSTAAYFVHANGSSLVIRNSELSWFGDSDSYHTRGLGGLYSNNSVLTGNSFHDAVGILILSSNTTFSNNHVYRTTAGITTGVVNFAPLSTRPQYGNIITNNRLEDGWTGVLLSGYDHIVSGNEISNTEVAGLALLEPSAGNNFSGNWIHDNLDSAVKVFYFIGTEFNDNVFSANNFSNNDYYGIRDSCGPNLTIVGNVISGNAYGGVRLGMETHDDPCDTASPVYNNISYNSITDNGLEIGGAEVLLCNATAFTTVSNNNFTYGIVNCTDCTDNVFENNSNSTVIPDDCPGLQAFSSCPFIYSFDGKNYWFEHESYQFSAFESEEAYSYGSLRHLEPVNGYYRLKLAERLDETSHTNGVRLTVADAPPGYEVMPDVEGVLHTMREKTPPSSAVDDAGRDALAKLVAADGNYWVGEINSSTDYLNAPDEAIKSRLDLEFPNKHSDPKLFLRIRASPLLYEELDLMLYSVGRDLFALGQQFTALPLVRDVYHQRFNEGALAVKYWDGQKWAEAGLVKSGREMWNEALVYVPASGLKAPSVKVRLESNDAHYEIDEVYADQSPDAQITVSPAYLESAITQDGTDARDALADPEDANYLTQTTGDDAALMFREVPGIPGMQRSFIVSVKGYYNMNLHSSKSIPEFVADGAALNTGHFLASNVPARLVLSRHQRPAFPATLGGRK